MSISGRDLEPIYREAVVAPNTSIRLEAPGGVCYGLFFDEDCPWLVPVAENLQRLLNYEFNWDSHKAHQIDETAMRAVLNVMSRVMADEYPVPRLSAMPDGGIQMEWRVPKRLMQVEVDWNGSISAYYSDSNSDEEDWEVESVEDMSVLREKLSLIHRAA